MNVIEPPLIVRLTAALFIIGGASSLVKLVADLMQGDIEFDIGFVGILIGAGLLAGKKSARNWAILIAALALLSVAGLGAYFALGTDHPLHIAEQRHLVAVALVGGILLAAVAVGLFSKKSRAWFNAVGQRVGGVGWTLPLLFVGVLLAAATTYQQRIVREEIEGMFAIDTRFEFRDAETAMPIHKVETSGPAISSRKDPLQPRYTHLVHSESSGLMVEYRGISGRPMDVTFTSDGYQPETYRLTKESPRTVLLEMKKTR